MSSLVRTYARGWDGKLLTPWPRTYRVRCDFLDRTRPTRCWFTPCGARNEIEVHGGIRWLRHRLREIGWSMRKRDGHIRCPSHQET